MPAKIYSAPKEIVAPDFMEYFTKESTKTTQDYFDACDKYNQEVAQWCRDNSACDIAGEIIWFPVADSKAGYVVFNTSPLELIELASNEDYFIDDITARGLRATDVRQMVKSEKAIAKLFGRPKNL